MTLPRQDGPLRRALLAQGTDDCIEWTGYIGPNGYGQAGDRGLVTTAHRRVWLWVNGPTDLPLDHLCRRRSCVNIRHLEPVTAALNNERARDAAQVMPAATHCKNGHEWTAATTKQKRSGRSCRVCDRNATDAYRERERAHAAGLLFEVSA
jgi:hypothetical protein